MANLVRNNVADTVFYAAYPCKVARGAEVSAGPNVLAISTNVLQHESNGNVSSAFFDFS